MIAKTSRLRIVTVELRIGQKFSLDVSYGVVVGFVGAICGETVGAHRLWTEDVREIDWGLGEEFCDVCCSSDVGFDEIFKECFHCLEVSQVSTSLGIS